MGYIDFVGGDNYVAVNRVLMKNLGVIEAVLYCDMVDRFKYYKRQNKLDNSGMFYCTVEDFENSTGIGRNQQQSAIKKLENFGLIKTCKKGLPAKRYILIIEDDAIIKPYFEDKKSEEKPHKAQNIQFAENQLTSTLEISQQDNLKSADKSTENQSETTYINKPKNNNNHTESCCEGMNYMNKEDDSCQSQEKDTSGSEISRKKIKKIMREYDVSTTAKALAVLSEYTETELHKIGSTLRQKKTDGKILNPSGLLASDPEEICQSILKHQFYPSRTNIASQNQWTKEFYISPDELVRLQK